MYASWKVLCLKVREKEKYVAYMWPPEVGTVILLEISSFLPSVRKRERGSWPLRYSTARPKLLRWLLCVNAQGWDTSLIHFRVLSALLFMTAGRQSSRYGFSLDHNKKESAHEISKIIFALIPMSSHRIELTWSAKLSRLSMLTPKYFTDHGNSISNLFHTPTFGRQARMW